MEDYSWCSDGLMSPWEFIKSHRIAAYRSKKMKIEHRLYLNVDPLDIYKVSIALIKKCISRNIPFDFKFDRIGNRDDTLIIYTDTEHLVDFISILNEIKQDHPDIVGRFKNPPILTGDIGGWIGYGSEPATRGTSFNEVRAKAIEKAMDEAVTKWIEDHFIRLLTYNNNTIHVYEYVTAIITEDIMKQLTSSYTWKVENEEKNAASKKEAPNYKKIYEDLGYTGNDLKNIKFKNYIYQHLLASLKNNLVDFLKAKKSETVITIPLKNGKAYQVTANKIQSATKRIVPTINKKDPDFKNQVKEAIKTKLDEVGVDINNIAFDKYIVEKFKTTSMPNIHKPKFKESTTVEPVNIKPQKVVAIESQRVIQAKESPLVHTTYVPSHRLIDELNSLLDYNSDKVIEFLYNNMIAIRLLLPIVIRKNKEIADEFYDANIKAHPELQNIYEQSLKGRLGGY